MEQLGELASEKPLVTLKALADLRHLIAQTSQEAAYEIADRGIPIEAVAAALGTSMAAARPGTGPPDVGKGTPEPCPYCAPDALLGIVG
ncbi:hypothetical protein ABZ891_23135 [Streptomyces sp. NPDC047023]|uniref:hypothetical protein n=1 Tax=Streptomyces sp. NPDC047023 TaxID=3155139 RepID=UPI0033D1C134